jgi:hypothetical protein
MAPAALPEPIAERNSFVHLSFNDRATFSPRGDRFTI